MIRIERLEPRTLFAAGALSEQIIVDQFGWRAGASRKIAIFADPINGQNAAVAYTPGGTFEVRRASDDSVAFTGLVVSWKSGATDSVSGDRVWQGDFSSLITPGDYYIYDATNALHSYPFRLADSVYNDLLKTSARMFYYQRTGTAIDAAHGGNWTHAIDHVGPNQDMQARQWLAGTGVVPGSAVRDVSGGWFDAGDYNKYVPFTTSVLWNLLSAYEWNPGAFPDNWNIPESGNHAPDMLDEVKYELDWLRKMQLPNGSVMNRVANSTYASGNHDPATDTQPRYYTAATTWATASFAASLAHASRVFASFDSVYPGYAATLRTAAENAWAYLQSQTTMLPANGTDGGGSGGSSGGLAAAGADANPSMDLRLRILAAAELYKTTAAAGYKAYFESNYKNSAATENGHHPLLGSYTFFDASLATELNRAYLTYATTTGASTSIIGEINASLRHMADDQILSPYNTAADPYRAFMWEGHYTWGSNQLKSEWANLLLYAIKLNVNPANNARYRELAEEYLHYFHGRNPLSEVYLTNMGPKGANLGGDKSVMQPYHSWFGDGSPLYDGATSTYGPVPGYLVGGANKYFALNWLAPPYGEPAMKAFRDWNTAWNAQRQANENSWEITEPAIYTQAAYTLLLSQFASAKSASPGAPDLDNSSDKGWNAFDNLTNKNNSAAENELRFVVPNTIAGATVSLYIDGALAASAIAPAGSTSTTLVTTPGAAAAIADGTHLVTATQTEPGSDASAPSPALSITIDTRRPQLSGSPTFVVEPTQAIDMIFDEDVQLAATNSVPSFANLTTQQELYWGNIDISFNTPKHVIVTFPGYPRGLPDGNYRALFSSIHLIDAAGNSLTNSVRVDFFVLAGDADRDRTVGPADFNRLATYFGQTGQVWSTGDFDYDGTAGPADFNLLASRFGTTLPPPPPIPIRSDGSIVVPRKRPLVRQSDVTIATLILPQAPPK